MKIVLEVPETKAAFMLELLESLPFVEAKPVYEEVTAVSTDTTTHLLESPTNRARLLAAVERANRGEVETHELIEE